MNYEEIDRSVYDNDVFTDGATGRYAKAKPISEKKKRAPKVAPPTTDDSTEQVFENGHTDEVIKTKKNSRKTHGNGATQNGEEISEVVPSADGETVVKPKKKRAPKVESNIENVDPIPTTEEEQPVKKKKSKAPKPIPIEEESQMFDNSTINELEPTTEIAPKIKKSKKHKAPKISADPTIDTFNDGQTNNSNEYTTNSELNSLYPNEGIYGSTAGDISSDVPPLYSTEAEQIVSEREKSEYEMAIIDAYTNLASKISFAQYFDADQWSIKYLPKSARGEPKSRIRKMLPGGKNDKPDGKSSIGRAINKKGGFLNRIRSGVGSLVRDENNLIFGEHTNFDASYYEEEEDSIDTDDLHRYAQKLRELEDTDRELHPEFLVLRDGKTVYAVQEADADGKMTFSTRKPIYDRASDQAPDDEPTEKRKLLSRFKNPFNRNKDKDGIENSSPKLSTGTPDSGRKRSSKKSNNKTTDDDMAVMTNSEPLVD